MFRATTRHFELKRPRALVVAEVELEGRMAHLCHVQIERFSDTAFDRAVSTSYSRGNEYKLIMSGCWNSIIMWTFSDNSFFRVFVSVTEIDRISSRWQWNDSFFQWNRMECSRRLTDNVPRDTIPHDFRQTSKVACCATRADTRRDSSTASLAQFCANTEGSDSPSASQSPSRGTFE